MSELELAASFAARLRDAHRRVAALDVPDVEKGSLTGRLIALTDSSKHDLTRASVRLDRWVADLDAGRTTAQGQGDVSP